MRCHQILRHFATLHVSVTLRCYVKNARALMASATAAAAALRTVVGARQCTTETENETESSSS